MLRAELPCLQILLQLPFQNEFSGLNTAWCFTLPLDIWEPCSNNCPCDRLLWTTHGRRSQPPKLLYCAVTPFRIHTQHQTADSAIRHRLQRGERNGQIHKRIFCFPTNHPCYHIEHQYLACTLSVNVQWLEVLALFTISVMFRILLFWAATQHLKEIMLLWSNNIQWDQGECLGVQHLTLQIQHLDQCFCAKCEPHIRSDWHLDLHSCFHVWYIFQCC